MFRKISDSLGKALARYLTEPIANYRPLTTWPSGASGPMLRPADVLLVEGNTRVSNAIKYLTQSTWSHAALCVTSNPGVAHNRQDELFLIEVDMVDGVAAVPLDKYASLHTRICRPAALTAEDANRVMAYALARLGQTYDMKNLIDLARYMLPTPPLPRRWRRRMMALGSGDPTKAICSTLIAQAFQSVGYPILPAMIRRRDDPGADDHNRELLTIRHYSLYAPRDFDISPYFEVVKPSIESGISYRSAKQNPVLTSIAKQASEPEERPQTGEQNIAPQPLSR